MTWVLLGLLAYINIGVWLYIRDESAKSTVGFTDEGLEITVHNFNPRQVLEWVYLWPLIVALQLLLISVIWWKRRKHD